MCSPTDLHNEIDNIYSRYKKYKIFSDLRLTTIEDNNFIHTTWPQYIGGVGKKYYLDIFKELTSNRQYTIQFIDGSFIQFYYRYSKQTHDLEVAKLAYYPLPQTHKTNEEDYIEFLSEYSDNDSDEYWDILDEINSDEILLSNTSHIRIDYDKNVSSHDKCEIQIDGVKELRIPLDTLIMPLHFLEFIIKCKARNNIIFETAYNRICEDIGFNTHFNCCKNACIDIDSFNTNNIYITFPR